MNKILKAILTIAIPPVVGALSAFLIRNNVFIYDVLQKPPFALPNNLFSVVWGVLYITIGVGLYLFTTANVSPDDKSYGLTVFAFQLLLNFFWPILFFNFRTYLLAFILLIVLFVFVAITVSAFYNAKKSAGIVLLPYLLFLVYAGYLNFGVWFLNM
ncbi:MAG: tryptophan-rich sensory protein [Clostridia bacterium]|nr:tryptophan-rich sensory protein [Clostridia bacterium]